MSNIKQMIEEGWLTYAYTENFYKTCKYPLLTNESRSQLYNNFNETIAHFKEQKDLHQDSPEGFAHAVHEEADRIQQEEIKKSVHRNKISCRKGCSFCCMLNVDITIDEAKLLVTEVGEKINWDKVERQSKFNVNTWSEMSAEDRKCVFLSQKGECNVYQFRPHACRNHIVISPPQDCDTDDNPKGGVMNLNLWQVEMVASAIWTITENGTMSAMLLKAKEKYETKTNG